MQENKDAMNKKTGVVRDKDVVSADASPDAQSLCSIHFMLRGRHVDEHESQTRSSCTRVREASTLQSREGSERRRHRRKR